MAKGYNQGGINPYLILKDDAFPVTTIGPLRFPAFIKLEIVCSSISDMIIYSSSIPLYANFEPIQGFVRWIASNVIYLQINLSDVVFGPLNKITRASRVAVFGLQQATHCKTPKCYS